MPNKKGEFLCTKDLHQLTAEVRMALLAYVLIRFIGYLGQWKGTFRRLFTLLRGVLFSRLDAFSIMSLCGTARGSPRMICSPEQAYLPGFELS